MRIYKNLWVKENIILKIEIIRSDWMEHIYCPEDDTYRIYCDFCDKLCIDRYYHNHLKSQTDINNFRRINSTN